MLYDITRNTFLRLWNNKIKQLIMFRVSIFIFVIEKYITF